jgi:hypothetical protein
MQQPEGGARRNYEWGFLADFNILRTEPGVYTFHINATNDQDEYAEKTFTITYKLPSI